MCLEASFCFIHGRFMGVVQKGLRARTWNSLWGVKVLEARIAGAPQGKLLRVWASLPCFEVEIPLKFSSFV